MNEGMKGIMTTSESFHVQLSSPMLYDRLHTLSVEYSLSMELLVNVAVQRLVADVDFVRTCAAEKEKGHNTKPLLHR